ncbi:longitudinals lacking protein, isoforms F/I/K/T-like isoform X2 [Andrena cerasifolii]
MLERRTRSIGEDQDLNLFEKSYASRAGESMDPRHADQHCGADSYVGVLQAQYVCNDCGRSYKWYDSLKRHQRVDCGNKEKKFSCHMCERKFKYRYELRNHLTTHHRI